MPRGFLVKRLHPNRHSSTPSGGRTRTYSDEDPSDSSSDHDGPPVVTLDLPKLQLQQPPPLLSEKPVPLPLPHLYHQHVYHHAASAAADSTALLLQAYGFRVSVAPSSPSTIPLVPRTPTATCPTDTPKSPPVLTSKRRAEAAAAGEDRDDDLRRPQSKKKCGTPSTPTSGKNRPKAVRKLRFDEETTSPVSGTIIRELGVDEEPLVIRRGDVDPSLNVVEVTDEAKAEIAKIENRLGDYICQLCKEVYDDAFGLAQHRCSRIVHVEYRCPECDKLFNCPANLASHRRWHKPRPNANNNNNNNNNNTNSATVLPATPPPDTAPTIAATSPSAFSSSSSSSSSSPPSSSSSSPHLEVDQHFECDLCAKKFSKISELKKHLDDHHCSSLSSSILICQQQQHHQRKLKVKNGELSGNTDAKEAFKENHVQHLPANCGVVGSAATMECKYCDTKFFSSPGLTRHINKYHPSENRQVILLHAPTNPGNPMVTN